MNERILKGKAVLSTPAAALREGATAGCKFLGEKA